MLMDRERHAGRVRGVVMLSRRNQTEDRTRTDVSLPEVSGTSRTPTPGIVSESGIKLVLVLAYMRSGSSLTGSIFSRVAETANSFYMFEPLHALSKNRDALYYPNGTEIDSVDTTMNALRILKAWYTCDLDSLDTVSLRDPFIRMDRRAGSYFYCLHRLGKLDPRVFPKSCVPKLKSICVESETRIIKTIRVSMEVVKHLVKTFPQLKIVHLVRDPRAVLYSQLLVGNYNFRSLPAVAQKHCNSVISDLQVGSEIGAAYRNSYYVLRYENLANTPIQVSEKLYKFIDRNFTQKVKNFVFLNTLSGKPDNGNIGITRSNSREHIDLWRRVLSIGYARPIDLACGNVYKRLGYLPAESTNLKNLNTPLWIENFQGIDIGRGVD
ncbi:hypothetical protein ScPMuIL_001786 [Solemya velum]